MPIIRTMGSDGVLVTEVSGKIGLSDAIKAVNDLAGYSVNDELYDIVVHDPDTEIRINADETQALIGLIKEVLKNYKRVVTAYVSQDDFIFGLSRQLEMHIENEYILMNVFRTVETARAWIDEMKS